MTDYLYDLVGYGAHPDDIEFTCSGFVAKMSTKLGYKTAIVDLTQGELGSRGTKDLRAAEAAKAAKVLGLQHRENLGLPDCGIHAAEEAELRSGVNSQLAKVVGSIRRLKPRVMLIPYPKCRHPDHVAAGLLLTRAVFFSGLKNFKVAGGAAENEAHTPQQVIYFMMRYQFRPSFIVDISDTFELKMESIRCFASQFGLDKTVGPDTLLSSPLSIQSIEARSQYYGAMIGVKYGEPFLTKNIISVGDPLKLFNDNPTTKAFLYPEEI